MNEKPDDKFALLIIQGIVVCFLIYIFSPLAIALLYSFSFLLIPIFVIIILRFLLNGMAKAHAKTLNKKEKNDE